MHYIQRSDLNSPSTVVHLQTMGDVEFYRVIIVDPMPSSAFWKPTGLAYLCTPRRTRSKLFMHHTY